MMEDRTDCPMPLLILQRVLSTFLVRLTGTWTTKFQAILSRGKGADEPNHRLDAAGSSIENLLNVRIYIRGEFGEFLEDIAPILTQYLGESRPALTGIGVASLASPDIGGGWGNSSTEVIHSLP